MVNGLLGAIASILTLSLCVEAVRLMVIKKDDGGYKFRPSRWAGDTNLEPYQKTIVVAAVSLGIAVIGALVYRNVFESDILGFVESLSPVTALLYNLALGAVGVAHYTYYIKEKQPDDVFWKLLAAVVCLLLFFAQLQYGVFNSVI
jgi:hypothetical protein